MDDFSDRHWLGCVVPKRHARRAVTRNLIKRQMRDSFDRGRATLPGGLWLLRLRAPYPKGQFVAAAAPALARSVRAELDAIWLRPPMMSPIPT